MNAFFTSSLRDLRGLPTSVRWGAVVLVVLIFAIFRIYSAKMLEQSDRAIEGILRSEYKSANSYALAKAISDLENLRILGCTTLAEKGHLDRSFFYDTSGDHRCYQQPWSKRLFERHTEFTALNGLQYELTYQPQEDPAKILLEILSYVLILFGLIFYARHLHAQRVDAQTKFNLLQIEKDVVVDSANQIRHDVASPISAMRLLVQAMRNVDPEVKDVLLRAVARTEEIFAKLNPASGSSVQPVRVAKILEEIAAEKRVIWGDRCQLEFAPPAEGSVFAVATELKRIVSNLMNNAFESLVENSGDHRVILRTSIDNAFYRIEVIDSGRGMPPEVMSRIGSKGFSSGKLGSNSSGQGLGVFHAKTNVEAWGGSLHYVSKVSTGTTATLILPRAGT